MLPICEGKQEKVFWSGLKHELKSVFFFFFLPKVTLFSVQPLVGRETQMGR